MKENRDTGPLTYDNFVGGLRSGLHYLYDPVNLRHSPLIQLFGLEKEFDTAAALQHLLTEAIRALKPGEEEAPQSTAWRIYDALNLQYIRQFSPGVVATQLGISERQLRRERRIALEALAKHLWQRTDPALPLPQEASSEMAAHSEPEEDQALSEELAWLKNLSPEQRIPLGEVLDAVCALAQPLAQQQQTPLVVEIEADLAALPVTHQALRSLLLTILSVAIPRAGQGAVILAAARNGAQIEIQVRCADPASGSQPASEKDQAGLETAGHLASFYGAQLEVPDWSGGFRAMLALPAPRLAPVLVIDDNADWLDMLKRYAVGSRYQVIGSREPETARGLVEKLQPVAIFLDVMMPNIDGWQIFSDLRHQQATSSIPIVICTVLPLEGLAISLGVNAFLQKPVTQSQFLGILDRLTGAPEWSTQAGTL